MPGSELHRREADGSGGKTNSDHSGRNPPPDSGHRHHAGQQQHRSNPRRWFLSRREIAEHADAHQHWQPKREAAMLRDSQPPHFFGDGTNDAAQSQGTTTLS
jgi:hypothetical protein